MYGRFSGHDSSTVSRLVGIVILAIIVHVLIKIIRKISEWFTTKTHAQKNPFDFMTQKPKVISLIQLLANGVTFGIYFFALGLILQEFGETCNPASPRRLKMPAFSLARKVPPPAVVFPAFAMRSMSA